MQKKTYIFTSKLWTSLIYLISLFLFASSGSASYLICFEANGNVGIEVEGINNDCSYLVSRDIQLSQTGFSGCFDVPISNQNDKAIQLQNQFAEYLYSPKYVKVNHPFPELTLFHSQNNYSTQDIYPVNLALLTIQKTVLLN